MIHTFIFDWSGVISDDRKPVYEANMRLLEEYGKNRMTFEEWLPKTTLTPREFLANHGVTEDPEVLYAKFKNILHELRNEGIDSYVYLDAPIILERLFTSGKKLFVISSHPEAIVHTEAKRYGIDSFFTHIQGNAKEKTIAITALLESYKILPSKQIAYTGDTIYDIQAAKKAGVFSIAITTGYHTQERLEKAQPDRIIDAFSKLLDL